MPFPKSKPRRGHLQRLSDQRRRLALAGLAVGAVCSAAILRRKRRGGEAEFETFQFETVSTTPVAVGPEAQVAREPEPLEQPTPINAAPPVESAAKGEPTPPASEPTTGELSAEEASILAVLAQSGRADDDRTALAVATSLERDSGDIVDVLRKLSAEGIVSGQLYTASGDKIWAVTERGVRRLGAQH